jgi:hypothetical protein
MMTDPKFFCLLWFTLTPSCVVVGFSKTGTRGGDSFGYAIKTSDASRSSSNSVYCSCAVDCPQFLLDTIRLSVYARAWMRHVSNSVHRRAEPGFDRG